jgi:hypothetical protein
MDFILRDFEERLATRVRFDWLDFFKLAIFDLVKSVMNENVKGVSLTEKNENAEAVSHLEAYYMGRQSEVTASDDRIFKGNFIGIKAITYAYIK